MAVERARVVLATPRDSRPSARLHACRSYNKVVWSEGLFLQPQHFQQQDRYFERYVESAVPGARAAQLGLHRARARARSPEHRQVRRCAAPPACFPTARRSGCRTTIRCRRRSTSARRCAIRSSTWRCRCAAPAPLDVDRARGPDGLARHDVRELRGARRHVARPSDAGGARGRRAADALPAGAATSTDAYACVPLAHIVECRADKQVVLDDAFIPTVLRRARGAAAGDVPDASCSGCCTSAAKRSAAASPPPAAAASAEIADFLMLQAINRYEPLLAHCADVGRAASRGSVPALRAGGGRARTFTTPSKRPPTLPAVPARSAARVVRAGDGGAARVARARCSSRARFRFRSSRRSSASAWRRWPIARCTRRAVFILAARADVPAEELRRRFPAQLKIGPVEKIRDLVNLQLPGVPVHAVPVAPRQIPYHAGFVYFELDQTPRAVGPAQDARAASRCTWPASFPGWRMEFWAIRG